MQAIATLKQVSSLQSEVGSSNDCPALPVAGENAAKDEANDFSVLSVAGGHAAKAATDEGKMFTKNGKVYKPFQELRKKDIQSGRKIGRGDVEKAFYEEAYHCGDVTSGSAGADPNASSSAGDAHGNIPSGSASSGEAAASVVPPHPLTKFMCAYYGMEEISLPNACASNGSVSNPEIVDAASARRYLVLEDITAGMRRPCVLDCKIGQRTYDEDATAEKIASEKKKYELQEQVGFRISGMRVHRLQPSGSPQLYQGVPQLYQEVCKSGAWGKSLGTLPLVLEGLEFFLSGLPAATASAIARALANKLQELRVIFEEHPMWRFYAASVLCVYDAKPSNHDTSNLAESASAASSHHKLRVVVIDFAHVVRIDPEKDKGTDFEKDYNFMYGLKSLESLWSGIATSGVTERAEDHDQKKRRLESCLPNVCAKLCN